MKWFLSLLTARITILMLLFAIAASILTIRYDLQVHHNMLLFGLVISFPLVFSLQAAFKRREKALEYISMLKSGLTATYQSFVHDKDFPHSKRTELHDLLSDLSIDITVYLAEGNGTPRDVYQRFDQVSQFISAHKDEVSARTKIRAIRYMKEVYNAVAYLASLKTHRTSLGIRYFSYIFLPFFSFVQAPVLNAVFADIPDLFIHLITALTSLILSSLLHIQRQLEDPFDQQGMDDIKLDEFRF